MKTTTSCCRRVWVTLLLMLVVTVGYAQSPHVTMNIVNCTATSNTIEFTVQFTNDGTVPINYNGTVSRGQIGSAVLPVTSNSISFTYIAGTSDFPTSMTHPSTAITWNGSQRLWSVSTAALAYNNVGCDDSLQTAPTISPGATYTIGRFRIQNNTTDFTPGANAGLIWHGTSSIVGYLNCGLATSPPFGGTAVHSQRTLGTPCSPNIPASCAVTAAIVNPVNPTCVGAMTGSFQIDLTGATAPVTWTLDGNPYAGTGVSNTFTGLAAGTYNVSFSDAGGCTGTAGPIVLTDPDPLTATCTVLSNVLCFGGADGAVSVVGNGGTGSLTVSGAPTSGLAAGTYTYIVTDANGCTASCTATITEPDELIVTASAADITCFGNEDGSVTTTVSGGSPTYMYSWSDQNDVSTYNVLVVAKSSSHPYFNQGNPLTFELNGEESPEITLIRGNTYTFNVLAPGHPFTLATDPVGGPAVGVITNGVTNNGTENGTLTFTPDGTTPNVIYYVCNNHQYMGYTINVVDAQATPDLTNLGPGTYTVVVTDMNGCTASATATVNEPAQVTAECTVLSNVSCFGGSNGAVSVVGGGGTGALTVSGDPTSGLSAGTYTYTVTDENGCTATCSVTISEPAQVTATCTVLSNVSCFGGSNGAVSVVGGGGTGALTVSGDPTSGLSAGTYTYMVTDENGCTATCTATITEPAQVTATCSVLSNVSCFGGSDGAVSVVGGGGTGTLTITGDPTSGLTAGTYNYTVTDENGCTATCSVTITEPAQLVANCSVVSNVSCFGGSNGVASVSGSGGTAPYTISGGPTNGLSAGTYTYTVTDNNGCTATCSVTITEPAELIASCSVLSNVSCAGGNDGAADVVANGGTGPYTVFPSTTGLAAGTYTFLVTDDKGCQATCSVTITEPAPLSATASATNASCPTCPDGTVTFDGATGGTGSYSVSPASPMTGLLPGTYCFTVTDDNGCTASACATVGTAACNLVANCSVVSDVDCFGNSTGEATVSTTGGVGPYSYAWSSGSTTQNAAGLAAGSYTVTVTDLSTNCTATCTVTISQPATPLSVTATPAGSILCFGGTVAVTVTGSGGTGPYLGEGVFNQSAGTDTYTIMDANGCMASTTLTLSEPTKVEGTTSTTSASCGADDGTATVTPTGGTPGYTYLWNDGLGQTTQTATGLSAGTYMVTITDANGCTGTATAVVTSFGGQPGQPDPIVGPAGACRNTTVVYSVPPTPGASSYSWTLPAGATGTSTTNSISITFDNTFAGGFICVTASNTCGAGAPQCLNIPVLTVKPHVPAIPTPGPIVCGGGVVTFTVPPVPNALSYTWSVVGAGLSIVSANGTNSIDIQIDPSFGQGTVRVSASNCIGTSNMRIMALTGIPIHSNALIGPGTVCAGTSNVSYFFGTVNGATSTTWSTTGDITIVSSTSTSAVVDFGPAFTSGFISVTTSNSCGSYTKNYTIRSVPSQPGSVSGPANNVCGQTGVVYTLVTPVAGATSYQWTAPAGATIIGSSTGSSITVDFSPAYTTGVFCISAVNACGSSTARCFPVIAAPGPPAAITGASSVCKSQTSVAYSVPAVPGVTFYSWSVTGGASISPSFNTATVNFTTATTTSAVVRAQAHNGCGVSQPSSKTVAVNLACRTADNDMITSSAVTAYPNPTSGNLTVSFNAETKAKYSVEVVDLIGNIVIADVMNAVEGLNMKEINLSNVAKGMYLLTIQTEGSEAQTLRIVVE